MSTEKRLTKATSTISIFRCTISVPHINLVSSLFHLTQTICNLCMQLKAANNNNNNIEKKITTPKKTTHIHVVVMQVKPRTCVWFLLFCIYLLLLFFVYFLCCCCFGKCTNITARTDSIAFVACFFFCSRAMGIWNGCAIPIRMEHIEVASDGRN